MRLNLVLAALVAVASALPSALTTREDFVEDDFEIQAEPDDNTKRSVGWPEVSLQRGERPSFVDSAHPFTHSPTLHHPSTPSELFCS